MSITGNILGIESEADREPAPTDGLRHMVHESDAMREIAALIRKIAPTSASVLLVGESGTGKEVSARALHGLSERSSGRFVAVDCGAIPETLVESELFGHEKGAFTGASQRRAGCFEMAHGGTLFLDELVSLPIASQTKLLRALEERTFRRLGGSEELRVDVRVIAAMNEDPELAVREGRLREDLYYRINVVTVNLPPLRERVMDIPRLVDRFIQEFNATHGPRVRGIDETAAGALRGYPWPGNVRELRNVIERALIVADGDLIAVEDLPPKIHVRSSTASRPSSPATATSPRARDDGDSPTASWVGMTVDEATRRLMLDTLSATGYNQAQAARTLGVSAKTVYNRLKDWAQQGDPDVLMAVEKCQRRRSSPPATGAGGRLVHLDSRPPSSREHPWHDGGALASSSSTH